MKYKDVIGCLKKAIGYTPLPTSSQIRNPLKIKIIINGFFLGCGEGCGALRGFNQFVTAVDQDVDFLG